MLLTSGVVVLASVASSTLTVHLLGREPADTEDSARGKSRSIISQIESRTTVREESAIIEAVDEADAAVVSVIITKDLPVLERYYERDASPFDDFGLFFDGEFGSPFEFRVPRERQIGTEKREVGGGTAFFISEDGLLLTNRHVVLDEEAEYTVLLNDGTKLPVAVVARDPANDIAILKAQKDDGEFPSLRLSRASLRLGQTVIAIGNSLGEFRNTVSVGVVSGLKRQLTARSGAGELEHLESIIQTDAAINQGNSGGPLLNTNGEVIGMNTAVAQGAQNIGFAIPSTDLSMALESYLEHGKILRAYLGVRYAIITDELKEQNNLPYDYGAIILRGEAATDLAVIPGSPADKVGLEENDIILEVDGERLTAERSLAAIIRRKTPGDDVRLTVFRDGNEQELTVTLEAQQ